MEGVRHNVHSQQAVVAGQSTPGLGTGIQFQAGGNRTSCSSRWTACCESELSVARSIHAWEDERIKVIRTCPTPEHVAVPRTTPAGLPSRKDSPWTAR